MSEFREKVWLVVIDKLLLGVAAAMIGIYVQNLVNTANRSAQDRQQADVRLNERVRQVTQVYTTILSEQLVIVSDSYAAYSQTASKVILIGRKADKPSIVALQDAQLRVQGAAVTIGLVKEGAGEQVSKMAEEMSQLNRALAIDAKPEVRQAKLEKVTKAYDLALRGVRATLRWVAEDEYSR